MFVLAIGFWFYQCIQTSLDAFGWQFRFLTIWGLSANVIVAWMMLRYSLGRSDRNYNSFVSASVVLNAIVVFKYWKLWFTDPSLINLNGPIVWYQEYYLHALGPALLMIDAFFVLGVFRYLVPTFIIMLLVFLTYIGWIEILVHPLNTSPKGDVTNGLPYPFLNNMDQAERLAFYATTIGSAVVFFGIGWVISKVLRVGKA